MSSIDTLPKVLLESEVAELLRCAPAKIKRLRLARKLSYYPGRPVTIAVEDLEAYVASAKVRHVKAEAAVRKFRAEPTGASPRPFKLLTRTEVGKAVRRSPATIRNWCLTGKIPYLPGRPALIDETDLLNLLAREKQASRSEPGTPEFLEQERSELVEQIRRRVRLKMLKRRMPRLLAGAKRAGPSRKR